MPNLAYSNVANLLPKTDFEAKGALGGALAGMQAMYGMNDLNNNVRLQELNNEMERLKYEESLKDVPLKDLQRTNNMDKEQFLIENPQLRRDAIKATLEEPVIKNEKERKEIAQKEMDQRAWTVNYELGQLFNTDQKTGIISLNNVSDVDMQGRYPELKARLEARGVKGLPSIWNKQTEEILKQHYKASGLTIAHRAEMEKTRLTGENQLANTKEQNRGQLQVENIRQAREDARFNRAQTASDRADPFKTVVHEIHKKLSEGQPLTLDLIDQMSIVIAKQKLDSLKMAKDQVMQHLGALASEKTNKEAARTAIARSVGIDYPGDKDIPKGLNDAMFLNRVADIAIQRELRKDAVKFLKPYVKIYSEDAAEELRTLGVDVDENKVPGKPSTKREDAKKGDPMNIRGNIMPKTIPEEVESPNYYDPNVLNNIPN